MIFSEIQERIKFRVFRGTEIMVRFKAGNYNAMVLSTKKSVSLGLKRRVILAGGEKCKKKICLNQRDAIRSTEYCRDCETERKKKKTDKTCALPGCKNECIYGFTRCEDHPLTQRDKTICTTQGCFGDRYLTFPKCHECFKMNYLKRHHSSKMVRSKVRAAKNAKDDISLFPLLVVAKPAVIVKLLRSPEEILRIKAEARDKEIF